MRRRKTGVERLLFPDYGFVLIVLQWHMARRSLSVVIAKPVHGLDAL
jgi:hypothetical protein